MEFTKSQSSDKASLFSQPVQKQTGKPGEQQVLLGALSDHLRSVLGEEERQEGKLEKIALLETVERLEGMGLDEFRQVSNTRVFRDWLCCARM